MDHEFLTFRKFDDPALASDLITLLDENHIEYQTEQNSLVGNPLLVSGGEANNEWTIKLRQPDFDKVNTLLVADETQAIDGVEKDYYLFDFTNEELRDVLIKADEWSAFDFALARKILTDRGISIDDKEIEIIKNYRLETLKEPEKAQSTWVVIGWICALMGGLLGMCIGWIMWKLKKTLPNGERVYAYTEGDRKQGQWIFVIGTIIFVTAAIIRAYNYSTGKAF